jgi:3-hydroxyacyl-CoA dehydrogenase / enoyl-CoA hydratase / 3-hydroxybutyryl-CoA epimerase
MIMNTQRISFEINDQVAYAGFGANCQKSMTVLDEQTLRELDQIVDHVKEKSSELKGLIFFSHKEGCFLAGADINLINSMKTEAEAANGAELGQNLFNKIEDLPMTTIACVHGVCLGGGMELALSCKVILASEDKRTQMGLPEVKLGLLPGFGGTYRMPKRVGLPTALDLILTGKTVDARKAKKIGLVAESFPKENLLNRAPGFLSNHGKKVSFKDSIEQLATDNFLSKKIIFQKARENVLKETKGFYQAPLKILDVMEAGMMKGRSSYLTLESQAFGELCVGEQSQNLRHLFFLMEGAKKYPGPQAKSALPKLKRGAVLGAGTMGGGIAWLMANGNMFPLMKDIGTAGLELGLKQASENFRGALKRRKLSEDDFERKMRSIHPTLSYEGFKKVDLVIEAIVENLEIKKKTFAELEGHVSAECLITSNTSSLSVQEMAQALEKPERFAGLHFFNPVHRMPLVEIISHDKVSPETLQALYDWVLKVKKTPVIVKDGPGFLVNRILMPYLNEAGFLLEEGVPLKDIDEACLNFGMPMGPGRLLDEVGIDVAVKVAKIIHDGLGDRAMTSSMSAKLAEKDFLGRKNNKGFYLYDERGKSIGENPELASLLPQDKKRMSETEIQMRVFLPMINEASTVLADGIVEEASMVDLGLIFGIGFPPFRGGLLRYADGEGLERIVDALENFAAKISTERYTPSDYLKNLVAQKKKFYE